MAIFPVETKLQWVLWSYVVVFGLQLLLKLGWLTFIRDGPKRWVLVRFLASSAIIAGLFVVWALLEIQSVDVRAREGDGKLVPWGFWFIHLFIIPIALFRTATFLHHMYTWKVFICVLGFFLALTRFFGYITSESIGRWLLYGTQVLLAFVIFYTLLARARRSSGVIIMVGIAAFLLGVTILVLYPLGWSQTNVISYFWEQIGYLIVSFIAHFVGPWLYVHLYERPAVDFVEEGVLQHLVRWYDTHVRSSEESTMMSDVGSDEDEEYPRRVYVQGDATASQQKSKKKGGGKQQKQSTLEAPLDT